MGELSDRRARKKAQTRELIRRTAQDLFAERGFEAVTIADVAAAADVAVQTVFNHFATKEDLFFDGRTPWVEGAAAAVRTRPPAVPPLTALRGYLVELVAGQVGADGDPEQRCYLATIGASPALLARERELVHEAECRLAEALAQAWSADAAPVDAGPASTDPATAAALTAATWLAVPRVLLTGRRTEAANDTDDAAIVPLTEMMLIQLEQGLRPLHGAPPRSPDAGSPRGVRQAG
ncbi:TetR/AcrR family transcriptional regulator [Geodermatophilus ruber]|uniref:Transcriptional regulator, TetR family n=1 Tax=Geodermatophilus ruber TaxID=504800 RepID=A0A1I4LDG5_9ACTN|nr:TetR family transcriptional regulator [Geodermatophilus ruber]SFL89085.1 transcriptional regulator, TetR family [Geodermatophilus ruber]